MWIKSDIHYYNKYLANQRQKYNYFLTLRTSQRQNYNYFLTLRISIIFPFSSKVT